jgi:hypothetical protein
VSFSSCFVAVTGSRDQFRQGFLDIWNRFRLEETSSELPTWNDMYAWSEPRSGYLKGKHPSDVFAFAQDGPWAVVIDLSLCLIDDTDQLALLSQQFGTVVAFATQGTSGYAGFRMFEGGNLRREIIGVDGQVSTTGAPVAAEQGIEVSRRFYLKEICALQSALGFSFDYPNRVPAPFSAIRVVDTTEYPRPTVRKRPWWKIW